MTGPGRNLRLNTPHCFTRNLINDSEKESGSTDTHYKPPGISLMTPAFDCFALSSGTFVVRRGRVRRMDGKSFGVKAARFLREDGKSFGVEERSSWG